MAEARTPTRAIGRAEAPVAPIARLRSKRTLATASFAIERFAAELGGDAVLVAAFQHRPYFEPMRATYDRLALAGVSVVTSYVGGPVPEQLAMHVELAPDEPLAERWDAVLVADEACAYVTAVDRHELDDPTAGLEPARLFAAEIGVDPQRAADLLDEFVRTAGDRLHATLADRLRRAATRRRDLPISPAHRAWGAGFVLLCDRLDTTVAAWRDEADLASHDALTGVLNRQGMQRWAGGADPLPIPAVGVVMVDLDGFKQINDSHGHEVGDRVLVAVAEALTSQVRARDLVVRWGGDEFVVLCPGIDSLDGLEDLVRRLDAAVGSIDIDGVVTAASFGTQISRSRPFVLDSADAAMYASKRSKPGRHLS